MKKFPLRCPDDVFEPVQEAVNNKEYQSANQYIIQAISEKNERLRKEFGKKD